MSGKKGMKANRRDQFKHCVVCGKQFMTTGGTAKYCFDCKKI